jgi:membrane dipeptidase
MPEPDKLSDAVPLLELHSSLASARSVLDDAPPVAVGPAQLADDSSAWARALGVSREAIELYSAAEVVDLHVDSFIWSRVFGYDILKRHGQGLLGGRGYSQVDLPRLAEARIGSALWSITTNPLRSARGRARTLMRNLEHMTAWIAAAPDRWSLVRTAADHAAARARGVHAAFLSIQGGNALDAADAGVLADRSIVAVTLVHLSNSTLGTTSSPLRAMSAEGLTKRGHELIERLNAERTFVDLSHVSGPGFADAVRAHDKTQPLMVSHTGLCGVHPLWRNIDDQQLKQVADTGGVVGVIFHSAYLGDPYWGTGRVDRIAAHLEHIVRVVGADHAALGSDWDGAIVTPRDMPTCSELPRLVQALLDRKVAHEAIQKLLGVSFLRALRMLRG